MNKCAFLIFGCLLAAAPASQAGYTTLALDSIANGSLQADVDPGYPSGAPIVLGGVPFDLPATGNNTWFASLAANQGAGTVSATLNVSVVGASAVDTLINTFWGQAGPTSYASIQFLGSAGGDYTYALVGNSDIRDYNNFFWTNSINGASTVNVVSLNDGQHRLDKQHIVLPVEFLTQTLTQIIFTDTGNQNFQRVFVSGVTVETASAAVPEPASCALMGLGIVVLAARRRLARFASLA